MDEPYQCSDCTFNSVFDFAFEHHRKRHRSPSNFTFDCCLKLEPIKNECFGLETGLSQFVFRRTEVSCENKSRFDVKLEPHVGTSESATNSDGLDSGLNQLISRRTEVSYEEKNCSNDTPVPSTADNAGTLKPRRSPCKIFKCTLCPYTTRRKFDFRIHGCSKHGFSEGVKFHRCQHCDYKTFRNIDLKLHVLRKHATKIDWQHCRLCDYIGKTPYDVRRHTFMKHTPADQVKWFECDQCPYRVKSSHLLKSHQANRHHGSDENVKYAFKMCRFETNRKTDLKLHVKGEHHRPRKYNMEWHTCELCGYKSSNQGVLSRHMKICPCLALVKARQGFGVTSGIFS